MRSQKLIAYTRHGVIVPKQRISLTSRKAYYLDSCSMFSPSFRENIHILEKRDVPREWIHIELIDLASGEQPKAMTKRESKLTHPVGKHVPYHIRMNDSAACAFS